MNPRLFTALRHFLLATALLLVLVALWIFVEFIAFRGSTPPLADATGRPLPSGIASFESIVLGGIPYTILIRGHDTRQPILLFLHGTPAIPTMFLAHAFQRNIEEFFVVVHWDRREKGRSSDSTTPALHRDLAELLDLVRMLRDRFQQERVFLVAHSEGTHLGMLAVTKHPEYFAAYIGMGQPATDAGRTRIIQRRFLYNRARASRDSALIRRLMSWDGTISERELLRYGGVFRSARSKWPILMTGLWAPEYDLFDLLDIARSSVLVQPTTAASELPETPFLKFDIPVYFFLGRHDYVTPSILADDYFLALTAPHKQLIWFERSAHYPFWEEPVVFENALRKAKKEVTEFWNSEHAGQ